MGLRQRVVGRDLLDEPSVADVERDVLEGRLVQAERGETVRHAWEHALVEFRDSRRPLDEPEIPVRLERPKLSGAEVSKLARRLDLEGEAQNLADGRVAIIRITGVAPPGHQWCQRSVQLGHHRSVSAPPRAGPAHSYPSTRTPWISKSRGFLVTTVASLNQATPAMMASPS